MHIIMISMISMCTYSTTIYTLSEYLFTIYVLSNEHQPFTSLSKCLAWRDGLRRWRDRHAGYFLGWGQAGIRKNCVFEWGLLKIHSVWDLGKKQPVLYWQYSFGMMASLLNLILLNEKLCHRCVDCLPSSWCPDRVSHVWMSIRKDALSKGFPSWWLNDHTEW